MASEKIPGAEVAELLVAAGAALGRRAWREARDLCEQALAGGECADALELLAVASSARPLEGSRTSHLFRLR
jgi:hypothetical protein